MIKLISQNGEVVNGVNEYIVDNKDELNSIKCCDMGSIVFIIETQETYILNGNKEWVLKETNITNSDPSGDNGYSAYWDEFWDYLQDYGNRTDYSSAFSSKYGHKKPVFTQNTFKPKYNLNIKKGGNMFENSHIEDLTNLNVELNFSDCDNFGSTFANCSLLKNIGLINMSKCLNLYQTFYSCSNLQSIEKIILPIGTYPIFNFTFTNCFNLQEIRFEGEIARSIDFSSCEKLSKESLLNIINILRPFNWDLPDQSTVPTLTIGNVNRAKLTEKEIQMILDKGWTIA